MGKLGDLFGHKVTFMASIVVFLAGSALCGMSQDMVQLVLFRAFQGLGAGGLMVGIMSVIGMMVSPRDRGKYIGVMMAVMPAAMIGGPLIGGFITDNASWRWAFYVNLPLGVLCIAIIAAVFHPHTRHKKHAIDYWGAAWLTVALSGIILFTTEGGTTLPWDAPALWCILAVAVGGVVEPIDEGRQRR